MFHLVSLSLQISLTVLACVCVCFCCLFCWVGCWFLSLGKFVFNHRLTPVVDRPSLALVRQCRKKKSVCSTLYKSKILCTYLRFAESHIARTK